MGSPFSSAKADKDAITCYFNDRLIVFNPNREDFKQYLTFWPNLKKMIVVSRCEQVDDNEILDLIEEKCASFEELSIEHWGPEPANSAFLLKLPRLIKLKLMLRIVILRIAIWVLRTCS